MEWKTYTLAEIARVQTGPFGSQLHNEDYVEKGNPIVTVEHLGNKRFTTQNLPCVSDSDKARLSKYVMHEGDIIFSRVGSVDRCSYAYKDNEGWLFSGRCLRVRVNEIYDPQFVYYCLKQESVKEYVKSIAVGATMPSINTALLNSIPLSIPPLSDQRRIASILASLDAQIENNNRINRNLEEQAQALFKSWFVDFEPWGGAMPEDWKDGCIGDMVSPITEKVGTRTNVKVLSPVTSGELVLSEDYFTKQVYSASLAKYKVVCPGSFAYNPARVNIGSLGRNEFDCIGCVSPVYVVFQCVDGYENYFDLLRRTEDFKTEVNLRAIGGVRQSLNYEDFAMIKAVVPSSAVVNSFNQQYNAIKSLIAHKKFENTRLSSLRDTLLPKLMSGEIEL